MSSSSAGFASMVPAASQGLMATISGDDKNATARENAETRADIAARNAQIVADQTASRRRAIQRAARETISTQRTALAETGVDTTVGSPVDLIERSQIEAELDSLMEGYKGTLAEQNFKLQEQGARNQVRAYEKANNVLFGRGVLGAAARVFSGPAWSAMMSDRLQTGVQGMQAAQQAPQPNQGGGFQFQSPATLPKAPQRFSSRGVSSRHNIGTSKPGGIGGV